MTAPLDPPMRLPVIVLLLGMVLLESQGSSDVLLGQIHTSTAFLAPLVRMESQVVALLEDYSRQEQDRVDRINRYISDWKRIQTGEESVASNPLGSFHLLSRIVREFPNLEEIISRHQGQKVLQSIQNVKQSSQVLPTVVDVTGVAWAIVHLQSVYNLPIDDVINGVIKDAPKTKELSGDDCFLLGETGYKNLAFNLSEKWTQKSVELWEREKPVSKEVQMKIDHAKTTIAKRRVMSELLTQMAQTADKTVLNEFAGLGVPKSFSREILDDPKHRLEFDKMEETYATLCRGEQNWQFFPKGRDLFCHHSFGLPTQIAYQPFKVEPISPHHEIVIFHDVITEREIEEIQSFALPIMVNGRVKPYATISTMNTSIARVGKSAWLYRSNHTLVGRLLKRLEFLSGLSTRFADNIHVFNYGIGGHYELHIDYFDFANRKQTKDPSFFQGDQIATFLFYLNDVDFGGSTVFPFLNVEVKPRKGAVLMWYNLRRSGKGVFGTMHASCPVLLGHKWIATLWLNERGQEFRRPCLLDPDQ